MNIETIQHNRAILFSTRMRFSPETQPVRETAIDKVIEQNLLIAHNDNGLSIADLQKQGLTALPGGLPIINTYELQDALKRLVANNRVLVSGVIEPCYKLSESAYKELLDTQNSAEEKFNRVVKKIFRDATESADRYIQPFLECLSIVFSRLGDVYVKSLTNQNNSSSIPDISSILEELKQKYTYLDASFDAGVRDFFIDTTPDFSELKWNMGQNYYISKVLGFDKSGQLLSTEMFGNGVFYLDTNIVIQAVEPRTRHHQSFQILADACRKLNIGMSVCQITLEELKRVVEHRRFLVSKVNNQIPDETSVKIPDIFYRIYRDQINTNPDTKIEELFTEFEQAMDSLERFYQIGLVDDSWFYRPETERQTQNVVNRLSNIAKKRGKPKSKQSLLHDALVIQWIQEERTTNNQKTWLVTLDSSITAVTQQITNDSQRSVSISLDALLQWISPIAINDQSVAAVFAEALKYQLLPRESFFDMKDFLMFADMELSCRELPAEDVEGCIQYLKTQAPNLNPSNSTDREKLAREVLKFFADPGRKYKQDVQKLESFVQNLERAKTELEGRLSASAQERQNLENELHRISRKTQQDIAANKQGFEQQLQDMSKRLQELEQQKQVETVKALKSDAIARLFIVSFVTLIYELIVIYIVDQNAQGANFFQKLNESNIFIFAGVGLWVLLVWIIVGRQRIESLGWIFKKIVKMDDSNS